MQRAKREISYQNINLMDFAGMLAEGVFLIPSFQRSFIWDTRNIIKLWDSIYHFYPIGAILCWDTDIRLNCHRRLGGFLINRNEVAKDNGGRQSYILDGQQRATAVFFALFGGKGKTKDLMEFDYTLYFDSVNASFFQADEFDRRSLDVNPAFLVRLRDVAKWPGDFYKRVALEKGYKRKTGENLMQLGRVFRDYSILLTRIAGFDIREVCEIFERINEEGKRLTSTDLMISNSFYNYSAIVEEDM